MEEILAFPYTDGSSAIVGQSLQANVETLVSTGSIDCIIVASEDGFTPFGAHRSLFASETGINENELRSLADWNRYENKRVTLIALPSHRKESRLRGLILAPSETSKCYEQFAVPRFGAPYRDFYYNVTYEALAYATERWNTRRFGTFHLSASNQFHSDIALCQAEAVANLSGNECLNNKLDSFCFVGCCITRDHLSALKRVEPTQFRTKHRLIQTEICTKHGYDLVHLSWQDGSGS